MLSPPHTEKLSPAQRARLLDALRALAGATLQKLWLATPALATLQLRVPGRTLLAVIDARTLLAALAPERPASPEGAPLSQATLRAALTGARFDGARLEVEASAPPEARAGAVRLSFTTEQGRRALIAELRAAALILVAPDPAAPDQERIVWAAAGAGVERRPGAHYPAARAAPDEPAAEPEPGGVEQEETGDAEAVRRALAREEAATLQVRRLELAGRLRNRARKLRRTLEAVRADAARAAASSEDRRKADLLVPHQSRIPRGAREARVPDWTQLDEAGAPGEAVLALDPALSAAQNAARWFKRAQRYSAAQGRIAARLAEVERAAQAAEALLARAEAAPTSEELRALDAEAAAQGAGANKREAESGPAGKRQRGQQARQPFRAFRSSSGARILVGRSAADNDELTLRYARGNDLWLHARGVQGSHVVVPDPGESPDARTLLEAGLLAAHFSSLRGADLAEVSWTRRKHVRKPKGAPAGSVSVSQEHTLRVRLEPALLAEVLGREERQS